MAKNYELDLPTLPIMTEQKGNVIPESQFTRRKLQGLLHIMTAELKARGTKTPHIFLPFRSRVDDTKLNLFLRRVFPDGVMVDTSNKAIVRSLLDDFDEFTLICGLKYFWCRLPNNEIIGWPVYLEFKRKEHEAGYPKDAFLTIMPKCLSSSSHASIVYDFLDLLISIASNSQYNHLNGRKIAKMASMWAFKSTPVGSSAFYDATIENEASFLDGLEAWKQTSNGLFHLLLSFLRAMLPDTEADTLNLPKTLQSLLITNSYPPPESTNSVKSVITIPCVHVRSTRRTSDPYELISKVRHSLSFEKRDAFLLTENFTILKNIFQKDSSAEIVSTLSEESRRVLTRLTADPVPSDFDLYPGWSRQSRKCQDPNIPLYSEVTIKTVTLQDYYIWTWLSSLASDQASSVKSLFGRSIVVEAGLKGFQKWMVVTETTIEPDEYISKFQTPVRKTQADHYSRSPLISPLPRNFGETRTSSNPAVALNVSELERPLPPPPPSKDDKLPPTPPKSTLPDVSFEKDHFTFEDGEFAGYNHFESSPSSDYSSGLSQSFNNKVVLSSKKMVSRPRPPQLEPTQQPKPSQPTKQHVHLPPPPAQPAPLHSAVQPEAVSHSSDYDRFCQQEAERAQRDNLTKDNHNYHEPYDSYETPFDQRQQRVPLDPFENYQIPGVADRKYLDACEPKNPEKVLPPVTKSELHNSHQNQLPALPNEINHTTALESRKSPIDESIQPHQEMHPVRHDEGRERHEGYLSEIGYPSNSHSRHPDPDMYQTSKIVFLEQQAVQLGSYEHQQYHDMKVPEVSIDKPAKYESHTEEKSEKKKKKKKQKKELLEMMQAMPNAPPPPLSVPMVEENVTSYYPDHLDGTQGDTLSHSDTQGSRYMGDRPGAFPQESEITQEFSHAEGSNLRLPRHVTQHERSFEEAETYQLHNQENTSKREKRVRSEQEGFLQPPENHSLSAYPEQSFAQDLAPYSGHGSESELSPDHPVDTSRGIPQAQYVTLHNYGYQEGHISNTVDGHARNVDPHAVNPSHAYHNDMQYSATRSHQYTHAHQNSHQTHHAGSTVAAPSKRTKDPTSVGRHPPREDTSRPLVSQPAPAVQHHLNQHGIDSRRVHATSQPAQGIPTQGMPTQGMPAQYMPPQSVPLSMPQHMPPQHAPPPPMSQGQVPQAQIPPAPQFYYPPPPQGYYPPPQGYGYPQQPVMYYPPPGAYYPPPPQAQAAPAPAVKTKPSASELTMRNMPTANAFKKNTKPNKANLRAALNQGFGL